MGLSLALIVDPKPPLTNTRETLWLILWHKIFNYALCQVNTRSQIEFQPLWATILDTLVECKCIFSACQVLAPYPSK